MKNNIKDISKFFDEICLFGHEKDWLDSCIMYTETINDLDILVWDLDNWDWLNRNHLNPSTNLQFLYYFQELHLHIYHSIFKETKPVFKVVFNYTVINTSASKRTFSEYFMLPNLK